MKRYTTIILAGVVGLLAAILAGVLIFVRNQPPQQRSVLPQIVQVKPLEPDSAIWGENFPNEWSTLQQTQVNNTRTKYGGSEKFSHLLEDPRQIILFAGYSFAKDYNEDRGHMNSLVDVRATKRLNLTPGDPKETHATCYSCKSSDNPALWQKLGLEGFDAMMFPDMTPNIKNPIGCANCHEAGTMRLAVTNPALDIALKSEGKDWRTFSRQEMRTVVCANCHVEYYFVGDKKVLTFPWANGAQIDQIIAYYNQINFSDWTYPGTNTPMLKAQHPEYETYTAGSTHYMAGVSCADCHMPYVRDGASKYSSHDVKSPLLDPIRACGQCHTDTDYVVARVKEIQDQVFNTKIATENALIDAITAIKAASANPNVDQSLFKQALQLHRDAAFMWDFVSAENGMGFHNPEYALKILANATNFARQAQMLASQSVKDPGLLQTDVYEGMEPKPTPAP
jgi:nitrite reductase (cytochrome c-552)